jgi:diketogulonate reductase-like aldo/keto reductase
LFITTKVWISNAGYEQAKKSIQESLERLQLNYLGLLLIHQPFNDYYGPYRAMMVSSKVGKLKTIGVSNFYPDRLINLVKFNEIVPAVNQVETLPYHQQVEAHQVMKKYGVQIQAWALFAEGKNNIFNDEILKAVGDKYNKSNAQVTLRFLIQRGVAVIPKTVRKERMIENIDVFDFELTEDDMEMIAALDKGESLFFSHYDPKTVEYLTGLVRYHPGIIHTDQKLPETSRQFFAFCTKRS